MFCIICTITTYRCSSVKTIERKNIFNAEYRSEFIKGEKIKLKDGKYRKKYFPDSASELRVSLLEKHAVGDLNGDGIEDAAVVLISEPGGSGTFYHLAVLINENGKLRNIDSILLGDRIAINSIKIKSKKIEVKILSRGKDDPMNVLNKQLTHKFEIRNNKIYKEY
ncbi:hypothetical protein ACFL4T_04010 [candidate division KSB1 bacterium]